MMLGQRVIHPAPRRGTIPAWKIRRAVRKVLSNKDNSKSAKTKAGRSLTQ